MRKLVLFFAYLAGGIVALAAVAAVVIYVLSQPMVLETFDVAGQPVAIPDDPSAEMLAHGARLARTLGCEGGCHGAGIEGRVMFEMPDFTRVVAPNVAATLAAWSAEDFERLVRHGVRPDGTGVAIMPSSMYHDLADDDYAALVAYLQTLPVEENEFVGRYRRFGPFARTMIWLGVFTQEPGMITGGPPPVSAPAVTDPVALGEYLVRTSCPECHGADLHGRSLPGMIAPDLIIASGYDGDQFGTLMREGIPADGRTDMAVMPVIAGMRGVYFEEAELDAMLAFLQSLAEDEAYLDGIR